MGFNLSAMQNICTLSKYKQIHESPSLVRIKKKRIKGMKVLLAKRAITSKSCYFKHIFTWLRPCIFFIKNTVTRVSDILLVSKWKRLWSRWRVLIISLSTYLMPSHAGLKSDDALQRAAVRSSPFENHISLGSPTTKHFEHHDSHLKQDKNVNSIIERRAVGIERASHSLPRGLDYNVGVRSIVSTDLASYPTEDDKISVLGGQCENGLFSSSLSELFSRKCMSCFLSVY